MTASDYTPRSIEDYKGTSLDGKIKRTGAMRGAHGQPNALRWVQLADGTVLFKDAGRGIYGFCHDAEYNAVKAGDGSDIFDMSAEDIVQACYLRGYNYSYHVNADAV